MDKNSYQDLIIHISQWKGEIYKILEFLLNTNKCRHLIDAINYRKDLLNEDDRNITSGFLSLGLFGNYENEFRMACFCICMEAEYQRELNKEIVRCKEYEGTEEIFSQPDIREARIDDLIDFRIFQREPLSNIFKIRNKWGYFDKRIPMQIYEWIEKCFVDSPCRIRIEPNDIYSERPPELLLECMIIPPQFQWWKEMKIFKGNTNGSVYQLLGNDIGDYKDYYDYNFLNIRRLDISESRKADDYISMMIEELEEHSCKLNSNQKYVLGRMIHLDSNASIGMSFKDAMICHIDLAFNLYINQSAEERLSQYLCNDQVVPACYRTHILRIENIPFESIFKIAYSFFKSKTLVSEWLSNEFKD